MCFLERRLYLKLKYDSYGSLITSDRLIQLTAFTMDKQTTDYHKAEKTIVLDEPVIEIEVWMDRQRKCVCEQYIFLLLLNCRTKSESE